MSGLGDLLHDLCDGSVCLPSLVLLDVPGVLRHPRPIHNEAHAAPVGYGPDFPQILQGEGMLSVGECLNEEEGKLMLLQGFPQRLQIRVPGKDGFALIPDVGRFDGSRRQKVHGAPGVGGNDRPGGDHGRHHQLDRSQDIVGRAEVRVPEYVGHRVLKVLEIPGARVGFIPDELTRELLLAHGAGAVGAHVEGDLGGGEVEGVESSFRQILFPLLEGREGEEADGLDFMRFVGHHDSVSF